MKLRPTHYQQLLYYLEDREESRYYYGNKEQFWKRHNEVKKWLEELLRKAQEQ